MSLNGSFNKLFKYTKTKVFEFEIGLVKHCLFILNLITLFAFFLGVCVFQASQELAVRHHYLPLVTVIHVTIMPHVRLTLAHLVLSVNVMRGFKAGSVSHRSTTVNRTIARTTVHVRTQEQDTGVSVHLVSGLVGK